MKTTRKWHKGPPPHVGWWNAQVAGSSCHDMWGWWNGTGWSQFASKIDTARDAALQATKKGAIYDGPGINWSHYYPENARVPRINPKDSK